MLGDEYYKVVELATVHTVSSLGTHETEGERALTALRLATYYHRKVPPVVRWERVWYAFQIVIAYHLGTLQFGAVYIAFYFRDFHLYLYYKYH